MRKAVLVVLSFAVCLYVGDLLLARDATQAQPAEDNKAICEIEDICLTTVVCDEDTGVLDADGDLTALTDSTGAKVKKAVKKKAAKKKATKKKAATRKKAAKKAAPGEPITDTLTNEQPTAATYAFNIKRGDTISDTLTTAQLQALFDDLVLGFFAAIPLCGDGVVTSPEVCEPEGDNPETCITGVCSTDCSECLPIVD